MRVEIDEEKKGKRNGLCSIHQHRDEFIPPRPLINQSQGIRTSTFVSNPHFENHELFEQPSRKKAKSRKQSRRCTKDPSIQ